MSIGSVEGIVREIDRKVSVPGGGTIGGTIDGVLGGNGNGPDGLAGIVRRALKDVLKDEGNGAIFQDLYVRVLELLATDGNKLLNVGQELAGAVLTAIKANILTFLDPLLDANPDDDEAAQKLLDLFPFSFRRSPLDALRGLRDLGQFIGTIDPKRVDKIERRFLLAAHSIERLIFILTHDEESDDEVPQVFFAALIERPTATITGVIKGDDPKKALVKFIRETISPKAVIEDLSKAFTAAKALSWADLPSGLPMGKLNFWLNEEKTYQDEVATPVEREFRVAMVAELDAYFRRTLKDEEKLGRLTQMDQRTSMELLVDLSCVFFDTLFGFILQPECYPLIETDWENMEDVGDALAEMLGEQLRAGIRSIAGSVPRGFWQWTVDNENLVEGAVAITSSIFAPIVKGIIRHLAWTIEIISAYPFESTDVPENAFVLHTWPSLEPVGFVDDSGDEPQPPRPDRLKYVAFVRNQRSNDDLPAEVRTKLRSLIDNGNAAALRGAIEDLGAYIDVGYYRFRVKPIFPTVDTVEQVTITRADIIDNKLTIQATSTAAIEDPRPVLRAYYCCSSVVMHPGETKADPYTLEIPVDASCRIPTVLVLSNRGAKAERVVQRVDSVNSNGAVSNRAISNRAFANNAISKAFQPTGTNAMPSSDQVPFTLKKTKPGRRKLVADLPPTIYRVFNNGSAQINVFVNTHVKESATLDAGEHIDVSAQTLEVELVGDEPLTLGWYQFISAAAAK